MNNINRTITRRMSTVFDGLQSEFRSLYTIEDFENKLSALRSAGMRSDRASKLKKLFDMFDACNIAYERGKDNAYYEKIICEANIPSFSDIEDRMLYALYTRYKEYPMPEEYMMDMVNKLCNENDPWQVDTLRLRILKQFIKYGNSLTYHKEVLDEHGKKKLKKVTIYGGENYIRKYLEKKTGKRIEHISDHIEAVSDDIFDVLIDATKPQKKPTGPYGLLKIVDDLAKANFRTGGGTKKSLYLFAMVYGMTYYSGNENSTEIIDYKTDIETRLFRDYYSNNFMRFISETYSENLCEYELDTSGQGINYKNYAEMVYLYYITKPLSPQDKIRLSCEMIETIQKKYAEASHSSEHRIPKRDTVDYRNLFKGNHEDSLFCEDILELPESNFVRFILENYNCMMQGKQTGNELQLEAEQTSAFREYRKIIDGILALGVPLEKCNYGLWLTDVASFLKKGYSNICDRNPDIDKERFEEFMRLILGINRFLGHTAKESISSQNEDQEWSETSKMKTRALFVPSAAEITRTSMIVAYYYYYNAFHENDSREQWQSFEEVFNSFKQDIDIRLNEAHYQPLSSKNIFDVLVTFSSYAYLNI